MKFLNSAFAILLLCLPCDAQEKDKTGKPNTEGLNISVMPLKLEYKWPVNKPPASLTITEEDFADYYNARLEGICKTIYRQAMAGKLKVYKISRMSGPYSPSELKKANTNRIVLKVHAPGDTSHIADSIISKADNTLLVNSISILDEGSDIKHDIRTDAFAFRNKRLLKNRNSVYETNQSYYIHGSDLKTCLDPYQYAFMNLLKAFMLSRPPRRTRTAMKSTLQT